MVQANMGLAELNGRWMTSSVEGHQGKRFEKKKKGKEERGGREEN